jgi:hypothetical protein
MLQLQLLQLQLLLRLRRLLLVVVLQPDPLQIMPPHEGSEHCSAPHHLQLCVCFICSWRWPLSRPPPAPLSLLGQNCCESAAVCAIAAVAAIAAVTAVTPAAAAMATSAVAVL